MAYLKINACTAALKMHKGDKPTFFLLLSTYGAYYSRFGVFNSRLIPFYFCTSLLTIFRFYCGVSGCCMEKEVKIKYRVIETL